MCVFIEYGLCYIHDDKSHAVMAQFKLRSPYKYNLNSTMYKSCDYIEYFVLAIVFYECKLVNNFNQTLIYTNDNLFLISPYNIQM